MRKYVRLMAAMFVIGVLSGCATTSTMKDAQTGQMNTQDIPVLDNTMSVYVAVTASNQDYAKERDILSDNLITKMKEDGFNVSGSANDALQKVEVNIIYLKRVNPGARFILGVLAGPAELNVIVNVSTPEKNGRFRLDTSALDWTGFAGTTEQTLAKVAERIAKAVHGKRIE